MDTGSLAQQIKTRVTLSMVVKDTVKLRGRSPNFLGLCPFHQEKTPSFHVRDQQARFKCFGCGASGDVFEFIMRLRGLSFPEAVSELANRAGLDLHHKKMVKEKRALPKEDPLYAQRVAQDFFVKALFDPSNEAARLYLTKARGLDETMIKQAGLGFGGSSTENFFAFLKKHNISAKCAMGAGLIKKGRFSFSHQFLSRITFPIRDMDGQIIAFGGRSFLPADEGPKYVNTHSYEHYEKRKNFYGLFESKNAILKGVTPLLVEGYFDAMAAWALGYPALALCGTALSHEHIAMLKRFGKQVTICFDSDAAGLMALTNSLTEIYKNNIHPSVIVLDKKDPGSYLADGNLEGFKNIIKSPVDALCFLIDRASLVAKKSVSERILQLDTLLPIFASIKRPLLRRQYVAYLASNLHEDPLLLWADINKRIRSKKESFEIEEKRPIESLSPNERLIIQIVLSDPKIIMDMQDILERLSPQAQKLIAMIAPIMSHESNKDHYGLIKQSVLSFNEGLWPQVEEILLNSVELTKEGALLALLSLRAKKDRDKSKETLKKMRLELQQFEKLGDFSSVLKTLKEQSALLMAQKMKNSDEKSALSNAKPPIKKDPSKTAPAVVSHQKIGDSDGKTFFDPEEDWL